MEGTRSGTGEEEHAHFRPHPSWTPQTQTEVWFCNASGVAVALIKNGIAPHTPREEEGARSQSAELPDYSYFPASICSLSLA